MESFDLSKGTDLLLYNDILVHAIANRLSLEDTYKVLKSKFNSNTEVNIDIIKRISELIETLALVDNDKAISLWARLLPTYREHLTNPSSNKITSCVLSYTDISKSLYPESYEHFLSKKAHIRSTLSRTKMYINKALPKGTILASITNKDDTEFTFISADNKQDAHKLLVQSGNTGLSIIDKLIASMGFIEGSV